jgi:hypothetical protein
LNKKTKFSGFVGFKIVVFLTLKICKNLTLLTEDVFWQNSKSRDGIFTLNTKTEFSGFVATNWQQIVLRDVKNW